MQLPAPREGHKESLNMKTRFQFEGKTYEHTHCGIADRTNVVELPDGRRISICWEKINDGPWTIEPAGRVNLDPPKVVEVTD